MTTPFTYTGKFTLDKVHFNECYLESSTLTRDFRSYFKSSVLMFFGLILLLFTEVNAYAAWFIVALGVLEALSVYYHKAWWVMRQMMSRASNSEVTITIDDKGVLNESFYHKGMILWSNVTEIKETKQGFVLLFENGKSYLSKRVLSVDAQAFINDKILSIGNNV